MYQEYNIYQYQYFKEIDSLCIALCSDEKKYIEPDSHFIHIPTQLFIELTNNTNINSLCFELTNPKDPLVKIFIKKIEPTIREFDKYILLPDWICKKLNIQSIGDKINFVPVANPKEIKRIKIQGNSSSYLKKDIKKLLELKIEQFRCINLGYQFDIDDVKFTVLELISKSNELVRFGSISNEVEIDFEIPDDIKLFEKKKYIMGLINFCINKKIDERLDKISIHNKKMSEKKTGIFNFEKLINDKKNNQLDFNLNDKVNLDEIFSDIVSNLSNLSNFSDNDQIPNPFKIILKSDDIQLIAELINEGKDILNKMATEHKLNNIKTNTNDKVLNSNTNDEELNSINHFNSTPYKLSESNDVPKNLSKEEIRKLRLEKLK